MHLPSRPGLLRRLLLIAGSLGPFLASAAQPAPLRDTLPGTWSATDGLGRSLPWGSEVGAPRPDRFVAMFYFLWLDAAEKRGPFDITRILAAHPEARHDPASPFWGPEHAMHHWGESVFGYYLADDPWVIRKHAQMLIDAGVDVIVFDISNKVTYRQNYTALLTTYRQMRAEGQRTPQVAFLTPFGDPQSTVHELYEQLYAPHLFEEFWFSWEGKPLILANPAQVRAEERPFFTFRTPQPSYFEGPTAPDMWSWLEVHPQHVFRNSRGEKEQMSVGAAQNAVGKRLGSMSEPASQGRSFHAGQQATEPNAVAYGFNFAEQWEHALHEDPQLVFVTGWNEWVAGRFAEFGGIKEPPMFVDTFDQEHSRDLEPMKGGHGDSYYYQLVSYIRRFKGTPPVPATSAPQTISVPADWAAVTPVFRDDLYDTAHRDHPGFAHAGPYQDDTGRNDFDTLQVARDAETVFFRATTREPITEPAGDDWMVLLIDVDHNHATGWEGYDLLVNRHRSHPGLCSVERNTGGWAWEPVGEAALLQTGSNLQISLPRRLLAPADPATKLTFDFKWADHIPLDGDISQFMVHGDTAPNARFNYRFQE